MEASRLDDYERVSERAVLLGGRQVRYFTKPGLPHWAAVAPGIVLLAEAASSKPGAHLALYGAGLAPLAVYLSQEFAPARIYYHDLNILSMELARQSFALNSLPALDLIEGPDPGITNPADQAFLLVPKGRGLARRWLVNIARQLLPGGELFLAGANEEGIQSITRDAAAIFGEGLVLGYKKGSRIVRFKRPAETHLPEWASEPGIAPQTWLEQEISVRGFTFSISSLPGVFSADRLDEGTALLLERLAPPAGCQAADLGCGYGIIGLLLAKLGAAQVTLIDSNVLAVAASRKNIAANDLQNARVLAGDGFAALPGEQFDYIASNPPFHNGKGVDQAISRAFVRQAHGALAPGGQFVLVANRFLPYPAWLAESFGSVTRLAETRKFGVYRAVKRNGAR